MPLNMLVLAEPVTARNARSDVLCESVVVMERTGTMCCFLGVPAFIHRKRLMGEKENKDISVSANYNRLRVSLFSCFLCMEKNSRVSLSILSR